MMKNVLLLLQLINVSLHEQNLFVDAKHKSILRGSQVEKQLGDGLPGFKLPEASATQNQRLLKDDKKPTSVEKDKKNDSPANQSATGKDKNKDSHSEADKGGKGSSENEDPIRSSRKGPTDKDEKDGAVDKNGRAGDKEDKNEKDDNDENDKNESDKNDQESPTLSPLSPPTSTPIASTLSPVAPPVSAPTDEPMMPLTTLSPVSPPTSTPIAPTLSPVAPPVSAPTDEPMMPLTMAPSSTINRNPVPVPTTSTISDHTMTLVFDHKTSPPIDPVSKPITSPTMEQTSEPVSVFILMPSSNSVSDTIAQSVDSLPTFYPTMIETVDSEFSSEIESVSKPVSSPTFLQAPETAPAFNLIPSSNSVSARTMAPSVYTANHDDDQHPDIEFDKTKFVAAERLHPIKFNMTVRKFTQLMNKEKLDAYFKDFIEDVLDMRSNRDWYPFNSKSVHNITMEFLPIFDMEGDQQERSALLTVPVQLIINGLIFVHLKDQGSQQTISINDNVPRSTFHDSFAHSMLLYFTFWGVDSLQNVLEDDGGIQNPVVNSVSVGDMQLITIDKDGNYFAYMDERDGSSNSLASAILDVGIESSARSPKYGVSSLIMISASTIWWCM
jgi:hypothetical protein